MKRIITIILVIAMVLTAMFSLAACSKTGECEYCGQKEPLVKYTYSNGDTVWVCNDCYRMCKLFG